MSTRTAETRTGGLGALSIGAEFTEFAFLAPILATVGVLAAAAAMLVRRRRRGRTLRTVLLPTPQVRHNAKDPDPAVHCHSG